MSRLHADRTGDWQAGVFFGVTVLLVALLLRAPISSVPPALAIISADLGLTPTVAGLATGLPLICFGLFAFLTPPLSARVGQEITLWIAVLLIAVGIALRSVPAVGTFFGGVTLVGLGIAIGNVIIPAIIRARFPLKMALMMGLYSLALQLSAAFGAASTEPLLQFGWDWTRALGAWLVPVVIIGLFWTIATLSVLRHAASGHGQPSGLGHVSRRWLSWAIALFMGLQSLGFYALLTWIPTVFVDAGFSTGLAAAMLTVFSLLGIPGSFLGPRIASAKRGWLAICVLYAVNSLGVTGLALGGAFAIAGTVLCGLCQGVLLAVALTFIAHQRDPADVPAVSALAQGVGYALAAIGPLVLGALYSATGGWGVPMGFMVVGYVGAAASAAWVSRAESAYNDAFPEREIR